MSTLGCIKSNESWDVLESSKLSSLNFKRNDMGLHFLQSLWWPPLHRPCLGAATEMPRAPHEREKRKASYTASILRRHAAIATLTLAYAATTSTTRPQNRKPNLPPGIATTATQPSEYNIATAKTPHQLHKAASAFVQAYWDATPDRVPKLLHDELVRSHYADMENRYSELVGARRLQSTLLVANERGAATAANDATAAGANDAAEVLALVGCEVAVVNLAEQKVLPRREGEALFRSRLTAMGARQRNEMRNAPLDELSRAVLPEAHQLFAVLSNLAVTRSHRRRGLARALCSEVEAVAAQWRSAGELLLLQVEEANMPARELYERLGFEEQWADEDATATRIAIDDDGTPSLMTVPTTLICMGKPIQ